MNRLKRFSTETQYNLAKDNFDYATVSWVEDVDEVRYMGEREKYKGEYLTFEALESGTFTLSIPSDITSSYMTSVSYSTDGGETWTTTTVDNTAQSITTPTIAQGGKVLWKGVGKQMGKGASINSCRFTSNCHYNISGNIMSLLYGDNFKGQTTLTTGSSTNFSCLFYCVSGSGLNYIVGTENLILPATTLTSQCYFQMFANQSSLITPPELPATTLTSYCYGQMFSRCSSLTIAPVLNATTLAQSCYSYMFSGCSLLTIAPVLPATTLVNGCYTYMFQNCSNLSYIKAMFTTTPSSTYINSWLNNVAENGTFVKNSAAQWTPSRDNVPCWWRVEDENGNLLVDGVNCDEK